MGPVWGFFAVYVVAFVFFILAIILRRLDVFPLLVILTSGFWRVWPGWVHRIPPLRCVLR